jgi:histidyl-tRNA synthetase
MKGADRSGAPYVIVIGERDIEADQCQLKTMDSGDQVAVPLTDIANHLKEQLQ